MATAPGLLRPLISLKAIFRQCRIQKCQRRWDSTSIDVRAVSRAAPLPLGIEGFISNHGGRKIHPPIKSYPAPPSTRKRCLDPVATVTNGQIAMLDPTGARQRLFSRDNPESAKVGDILLVRLKNGEPFAGVCMNIRRRGVDTGILLRNQLTRIGVEMWFKIYSPKVTGIEVVQRRVKRARRARLYYMRKPKHDLGSVENIVRQYVRQRAVLGTSSGRGDAALRGYQVKKKKKGKGKGRK